MKLHNYLYIKIFHPQKQVCANCDAATAQFGDP